jgi:RNA polymerase sigma-70 factor (ECF subfamily)
MFERLYRETFEDIYRYCARRLDSDHEGAADVVAEIYTTAWRRVDSLLDADDPTKWLYGVARKTLANRYRSRNRWLRLVSRVEQTTSPDGQNPADDVEVRISLDKLRSAIADLDPADRDLLALAVWDGLSYEDIADVAGISAAAVRSRLYRVRQGLKAQISDDARDDVDHSDTQPDTGRLDRTQGKRRPPR